MTYRPEKSKAARSALYGLLMLGATVLAGCNSDPACQRETALLRAEILDLEDKYYALKSRREFDAKEVLLESGEVIDEGTYLVTRSPEATYGDVIYDDGQIIYEGEPVSARRLQVQHEIAPGQSSPTTQHRGSPAVENLFETISPNNKLPSILSEPKVDRVRDLLPNPPGSNNQSRSRAGETDIEIVLEEPNHVAPRRRTATTRNFRVADLVVNRLASGGEDVDGQPGDDGLTLLVQPRNDRGEIGLATGRLTVNLIDPSQPASKRLVGHWNFLPEETELFFAEDHRAGKGILLHLPWEQNTPAARQLIVSVQMKTDDGKTVETTSEVRITPPPSSYSPDSPLVAGWTRRDSRWNRGSELVPNRSTAQPDGWRAPEVDRQRDERDEQFVSESPRVKAMPASSTSNVTKPRWRPSR